MLEKNALFRRVWLSLALFGFVWCHSAGARPEPAVQPTDSTGLLLSRMMKVNQHWLIVTSAAGRPASAEGKGHTRPV